MKLFYRAGNRVELTDAGRILADYAGRVATLSEEVRRVLGELAGLKRGFLRLAASSTPGLYLLPEVLARFGQRYPGIELSLWLGNSGAVAQQVLQGAADLGFVGLRPELPGLQVRPFAEDQIVLATPPGHRLTREVVFNQELLAGETLILREAGSGTRRVVEDGLVQLQVRPGRVLEMAGCEGVKRGVAAGLGVGFVIAAQPGPGARPGLALHLAHRRAYLSAPIVHAGAQGSAAHVGGAGLRGDPGQGWTVNALERLNLSVYLVRRLSL